MSADPTTPERPVRAKISRSPVVYSVTIVSTPPFSGGMTVHELRDFMRAIDEAGVPDGARLIADCSHDTSAFTGLRVHHTFEVAEAVDAD